MEAIKQKIEIPKDRHVKIEFDIPSNIPAGEAEVICIIETKQSYDQKRVLGLHKNKIKMSDDFDEPLSDSFWLNEK